MATKTKESSTKRLLIAGILILALLVVATIVAALFSSDLDTAGANIAIIKVSGPITGESATGIFSGSTASATQIVALLEKAQDERAIKGVILEINSPGGSPVASDEIAQAIKNLEKPIVAQIRESGASGAYWIASSADHIVANRMSITGSIGVIASYIEFDEFLREWNLTYNRLVAGERKDVGDPFTELTPQERAFLEEKLAVIHGFFIEEVAQNRNLTLEQMERISDGRFLLGIEALEAGLVDELGGRDEAVEYLEERLAITAKTIEYEEEQGLLAQLFGAEAGPQSRTEPQGLRILAR